MQPFPLGVGTISPAYSATQQRPLSIIELCLSSGRGGLERYAAGLVPALAERGHKVTVVAQPDSEFSRLTGRKPTLRITPSRLAPLRGVRCLTRLAREADVIHIHRGADLPIAVAAKWLAGQRPALVYSQRMAITRNRYANRFHVILHRQVDRLLPMTDMLATEARAHLPLLAERIVVLRPGIARGPDSGDCRKIRPRSAKFVVGCFSQIEPAKGQHELIAAIQTLHQQGMSVGAVIAGPVMNLDYAAALRRQVSAAGIARHIRFLSTTTEIRPAMGCCDVVVLPSAAETLGLTLVEAMQMGVPVVGTAAGGVPELIVNGETGLTYPPGDHLALARCLARLAGDRELAAGLGRAGQAHVQKHYAPDRHLDRLEHLLRTARD